MSVLISNLNTIESVKLDIKSAIEAKGVSMSGVSFPDYPSAIASISGGGGGYTEKDITEGLSFVILNNSASYVGSCAFYGHRELTTVSLPNCTSLYNQAFEMCDHLQTVYLPNCTHIGDYTPYQVANEAHFQSCSSLTTISIPACTVIGGKAFWSCILLPSIDLPCCISIDTEAFKHCRALSTVHLSVCTIIQNSVFQNCSALSAVYIYTSSVCLLSGSKVFSSANNALVYVPASLVDVYKSANNWSSMSSRIFSIPE